MKQLKFWAIAFSLNKILLYTGAISIIFILAAINIDTLRIFLYLSIAVVTAIILILFFVTKRVRITLKEDVIHLKMNGKQKITYNIEELQYVRGTNINLPKSQGEINLVFNDKIFTFNIFDARLRYSTFPSKQVRVLTSLIETYNLEDRGQDKKHLSKLHVYWNPRFKK